MPTQPIVLACTDGSIYANSIYDHASWAARQLDAQLHVLHMLVPLDNVDAVKNFSGSIGLDVRQTLKAELIQLEEAQGRVAQARADAILEAAKAHLSTARISHYHVEARHGSLIESIGQYHSATELIVIGKRGESADFEQEHLGANVERVIRSCHHPVLVASRSFKPIERVLIAYDGGRSANKAVDSIISQPLLRGTQLHLLAVGKPHANIKQDLASAQTRLQAAGYPTESTHLDGHPEEVFARFIPSHQIDLLMMGAYGHSRIRQLIVGSTTTTMVRTSPIPVLMFR